MYRHAFFSLFLLTLPFFLLSEKPDLNLDKDALILTCPCPKIRLELSEKQEDSQIFLKKAWQVVDSHTRDNIWKNFADLTSFVTGVAFPIQDTDNQDLITWFCALMVFADAVQSLSLIPQKIDHNFWRVGTGKTKFDFSLVFLQQLQKHGLAWTEDSTQGQWNLFHYRRAIKRLRRITKNALSRPPKMNSALTENHFLPSARSFPYLFQKIQEKISIQHLQNRSSPKRGVSTLDPFSSFDLEPFEKRCDLYPTLCYYETFLLRLFFNALTISGRSLAKHHAAWLRGATAPEEKKTLVFH